MKRSGVDFSDLFLYNQTMKTFYLDMDGVVADFDKAAMDLVGYDRDPDTHKWNMDDWNTVRQQHRWFRDLPKTSWADELANHARRLRDEAGWQLLFLTAIPAGNDFPWAFYDKILWAGKHVPDIPVHFGPYSVDKQKHAKPGDVLVDDRLDNCEQWQSVGGTAFRLLYRRDPLGSVREIAKFVEDQIRNKTH